MAGAIGGAPVGAITILLGGSFAPPVAAPEASASSVEPPASNSFITAYIPDGSYAQPANNIEVVPVAGSQVSRTTILTRAPVNSCGAQQTTGEVVCTDNGTGIYLISGTMLMTTLTSSGASQETFSGGNCTTCGVVVDTPHNQAIISIANNPSPTVTATPAPTTGPTPVPAGPGAFQILNLSNTTLGSPISPPNNDQIAESFGLNTSGPVILSPDEQGNYDLIDISNPQSPIAYQFAQAGQLGLIGLDTGAVDSSGVAVAGFEGVGQLFLTDLSQATFNQAATPRTWNAPSQVQVLNEFDASFGYFSAGLTGLAIATGAHEVFAEDEFGSSAIGAMKLASGGAGNAPSASDWVVARVPDTPDNAPWQMPLDPHGMTAALANASITSSGVVVGSASKGLGFLVNSSRTWLAIVDLDALLASPRASGQNGSQGPEAHQLDPNYAPLQNNVVTFVSINSNSTANFLQNGDFNDGMGFYTTGIVSRGSFGGTFPHLNVLTSSQCSASPVGMPYFAIDSPGGADGFFQQQVTLPKQPTNLIFSTWGNLDQSTVTVTVIDSNNNQTVLGTFNPPSVQSSPSSCSGQKPITKQFSLGQFASQTVTIRFEGTSNGSNGTFSNFANLMITTSAAVPELDPAGIAGGLTLLLGGLLLLLERRRRRR